jgi:hypothetical protein
MTNPEPAGYVPPPGTPLVTQADRWQLSGDTQHRSLSINEARLLFLTVESARS